MNEATNPEEVAPEKEENAWTSNEEHLQARVAMRRELQGRQRHTHSNRQKRKMTRNERSNEPKEGVEKQKSDPPHNDHLEPCVVSYKVQRERERERERETHTHTHTLRSK
jgi:hypothetical protein